MLNCFSHVQLFAILWTIARQAPLSMGFSRQEYWTGLPCPPPGDLPDPGIKLTSLRSPALSGGFFTTSAIWEAHSIPVSGNPMEASTATHSSILPWRIPWTEEPGGYVPRGRKRVGHN